MAKKAKVKITWFLKYPLKMASTALGTVTAMRDNDYFNTPDVLLTDMYKAANNVSVTYADRKNGQIAKDEFNTANKLLNEYLHKQAEYVDDIADGDETIIHSAAFESTSTKRGASVKVDIADNLKLTSLIRGSIRAEVDKVNNATNYCFMLVMGDSFNIEIINGKIQIPEGALTYIINSTKKTVVFKGLPAMKQVCVAVIASCPSGFLGISPVATASTIL